MSLDILTIALQRFAPTMFLFFLFSLGETAPIPSAHPLEAFTLWCTGPKAEVVKDGTPSWLSHLLMLRASGQLQKLL